ncbi:acyl-CoA dehydrogenase family protein [Streptomyces sp. NPDC005279]|uniref:acyl-CoA dehydrogenase family protein n=1 Tax=Streptomyces sp. NPDC005279 TaxID=3364712 RepID=UPI00369028B0
MRFLLTDEQRALARSLDAMLTAADTPAAVRAWSAGDHAPGRALCSRLAQAGVFALAAPEAYEGVGMLPVELAVSFVELGRHAVPGSVVETVATAALLTHLAEHGDTSPAKRLLPGLATGESTATLALTTAGYGPYALDADAATVTLVVSGGGAAGGGGPVTGSGRATARTGTKPEAAAGEGTGARAGTGAGPGEATRRAGATPACTRTGDRVGAGATAAGPRAGVSDGSPDARLLIAPGHGPVHASADPARRLSVPGAGGEILAEGPRVAAAAAYAADVAAFATAAQALGVGLALLDRTVAHAKRRSQFGAAIGSFQAVKHRLADTLIGLEFARPLLYGAALSMAPADIAAAKATAGEAAYAAARTALQLHGAVGYTDELDLSLWLRKARPLRDAWGTPARCRARVLSG